MFLKITYRLHYYLKNDLHSTEIIFQRLYKIKFVFLGKGSGGEPFVFKQRVSPRIAALNRLCYNVYILTVQTVIINEFRKGSQQNGKINGRKYNG